MKNSKKQSTSLVLVADYIFYLLPFIILLIIRLAQDKFSDLLLISDWSIASTIMYGQIIVKLSSALASTNREKKIPAITLYLTILVCLGLVVNIVVYVLMLVMPSVGIGRGCSKFCVTQASKRDVIVQSPFKMYRQL